MVTALSKNGQSFKKYTLYLRKIQGQVVGEKKKKGTASCSFDLSFYVKSFGVGAPGARDGGGQAA